MSIPFRSLKGWPLIISEYTRDFEAEEAMLRRAQADNLNIIMIIAFAMGGPMLVIYALAYKAEVNANAWVVFWIGTTACGWGLGALAMRVRLWWKWHPRNPENILKAIGKAGA